MLKCIKSDYFHDFEHKQGKEKKRKKKRNKKKKRKEKRNELGRKEFDSNKTLTSGLYFCRPSPRSGRRRTRREKCYFFSKIKSVTRP